MNKGLFAGLKSTAAAVVRGVANKVGAVLVITPTGPDESGIIIKAPDAAWGATGVSTPRGTDGYGTGQFIAGFREGGDTASDAMMWRIDRTGGFGTGGSLHVATGLNQQSGYAATQASWLQLYLNTNGLVVTAPTTAAAASWTSNFILCTSDRSGTARAVFFVDANGMVSAPNGPSSATRFRQLEHFVGTATQTTNGSQIGTTLASALLSGTGAQITNTSGVVAVQGAAAAETGSTSTGRGGIYFASNPVTFTAASTDVEFGARVYVTTLSTAGEQHEVRVGLNVSFGATVPANGLYFRLQHGDTNWEAVNARGGVETVVDSGVAGVAATWVNLKVVYTAGGDATYYINNVLVATISTNKPTDGTVLFPVAQIVKAAGTTTRVLGVDAMNLDLLSDIDLEQILS